MRVGLGVTALRTNLRTGQRDGIGVYSDALSRVLREQFPMHDFYDTTFDRSGSGLHRPIHNYEVSAGISALFGVRYRPERIFGTDFDLFHALDHYIPRLTIPVVATLHDAGPLSNPDIWPGRFRFIKNLLYSAKCRFPARVIAVSKYTADEVMRYAGVKADRIDVIYEGVGKHVLMESMTPLDWSQMNKRYGLEPGFIAYCGSISKKKNVARLLAAHEALPITMRQGHPLVLIGGIPAKESMDAVVDEIRRKERAGTAKWLGTLPNADMARVLHHSELFVFPSLHEGFGLPVVEAFQLGLPVLTSNVAALPEIAGDCAALVNPTDVRELSRALERLLREDVLRREFADRGKARAVNFRWEKCAKRTLEAYDRVLA